MKSIVCSLVLAVATAIVSTPLAAQTAAPAPSAPPAPAANTPERLILAFQKQKDPRALADQTAKVGAALTKELGMAVEVMVPSTYSATVQAMVSGKAHVGYMSSVPYLLAKGEAPVEILLAEVRGGRPDYDSIFVVRKDAPYRSIADLKGARMAYTSATSTSGYVFAYGRLVDEGLLQPREDSRTFFSETIFAGGYDRALLAVANGQADVAAVSDYTMEGAKADVYLKAEQRAKLRVLDRTPGVPTHLIAVRSDLPQDLRDRLRAALLKLSKEQPALLADVYGAAEFAPPADGDGHVAATRAALEKTGLGLEALAKAQ